MVVKFEVLLTLVDVFRLEFAVWLPVELLETAVLLLVTVVFVPVELEVVVAVLLEVDASYANETDRQRASNRIAVTFFLIIFYIMKIFCFYI